MKPDTERKRYHSERLHRRKKRMNVHLSKELRGKVKTKRRPILLHNGDTVKVMRGPGKGKEAKVSRLSTTKRKVYLEGVVVTNARKKEVAIALEPSNLMLIALEPTEERKKLFSEDAFKKKAPKKEEKKAEAKKEAPEEEGPAPAKEEPKKEEEKAEAVKPQAPKEKPPVPPRNR